MTQLRQTYFSGLQTPDVELLIRATFGEAMRSDEDANGLRASDPPGYVLKISSEEKVLLRKQTVTAFFVLQSDAEGTQIDYQCDTESELAAVKVQARFVNAFKSSGSDFLVELSADVAQKFTDQQLEPGQKVWAKL